MVHLVPGLVFSVLIVASVGFIIFTNNVVRAAYALVACLLGLACLYVLLNAEFMAVVQILVYAGGVAVLLIFGIMLTRSVSDSGIFTEHRQPFLSGVLVISLLFFVGSIIQSFPFGPFPDQIRDRDQITDVGISFMTNYLLAFELIAFILLVVLVGAAFVAKRSAND